MRIAVLHDFFGTIGGGEKLVLEMAKGLGADVITTHVDRATLKKIGDYKVESLGEPWQLPVLKQISASYLFSRAKLNYDVYILSGNWAIFAAKKNKPSILYCHTPVRMFYQDYEHFYRIAPFWAKPFFTIWVFLHKKWLERYLPHIGKIIANSDECKRRVSKYYKRECTVVYPPIKQYKYRKNGDFWLSVNRIYPHKRLELQIESFRRMPDEKLVIVGGTTKGDHSSAYMRRITKNPPANIIFLGEVTETELARLYGDCKAFITTSQNEDFGMTVLEAMSAGKPVVATAEGGHLETMISGKTGYLVKADPREITEAVKKISKDPLKFRSACEKRAKKYSVNAFIQKMKHELGKSK